MVFSSVQFLFVFFPLFLLVYYIVPRRLKNLALVGCSLLFYAWGGLRYTVLILASILGNWLFGLWLGRRKSRAVLALSVVFNLGMLGWFKYYDFFAENVNRLIPELVPVLGIVLPIGISFYTFQAMSYVIDLYRGQIPVQRSLLNFALYVSLFPQLIAGPIVRYCDIEPLLPIQARQVSLADFTHGIKRFIIGLGKKVLIANLLGQYFSTILSVSPAQLPWSVLALAAVLYPFQLYYDFSGYSDMAIGMGYMFGFRFPENFKYPYMSRSVSEFWQRWHITLHVWFVQYLYIPLGGSRCSTLRNCFNLLVVFFLTGLWHGAAWQFVAFGMVSGVAIVAERLGLRRLLEKLPRALQHVYTLAVVFLGFFFFGATDLGGALLGLRGLVTLQAGLPQYRLDQFIDLRLALVLVIAILGAGPLQSLFPKFRERLYRTDDVSVPGMVCLMAVLLLCILRLTAGSYNAFIYFRF